MGQRKRDLLERCWEAGSCANHRSLSLPVFVWRTRSELCLSNLLSPLLEPSNKEPNLRHALQQTQWDPWTQLDVKSKLFRDFGEQLYDRRAVKKCPFGGPGILHQASKQTPLFDWLPADVAVLSRTRFFKQAWGKSLRLSGQCNLVQVKEGNIFCFLVGFIVFSNSRADSHLGWTITPLGLNRAGLPDLGANISGF